MKILSKELTNELGKGFSRLNIQNMRNGKVNDDGYRGIHLYYQNSNKHYPIEIQVNTKSDRIINDWLHIHLYKHIKNDNIGKLLREKYDNGVIKDEEEFKEVLEYVLSNSKEI